MDRFTRDDLRALLANQKTPCVSLFMPTTRGPKNQDKILWKNLLREAEERLLTQGHRPPEVSDLLAPARELLDNAPFWLSVSTGLAAFLSPEMAHHYRLPATFKEEVVCADRFHVKPVVPLLTGDGPFYVLALSKKSVRLFQGSHYTAQEIGLPAGVPTSLEDALRYGDEIAHDRQFRAHTVRTFPSSGGPAGTRTGVLHGQGPGVASAKDGLVEFCQRVDRGLHRFLHDKRAPLVLAADTVLMPVYRQANTYHHLLAEGVEGSPERLSAQELHDRAWPVVQPHFEEARERIAALYQQLAARQRAHVTNDLAEVLPVMYPGHTSNDLAEVLPAAYQGYIQYLFVARDREQWGTFDPANLRVAIHDRPEPGDEDLLNLAVVHALSHGATVWVVAPQKVPDNTPVAAVHWLDPGQRSSKTIITVAP
jgi:Bacterial archaeo-eukaryotic release factor family 7